MECGVLILYIWYRSKFWNFINVFIGYPDWALDLNSTRWNKTYLHLKVSGNDFLGNIVMLWLESFTSDKIVPKVNYTGIKYKLLCISSISFNFRPYWFFYIMKLIALRAGRIQCRCSRTCRYAYFYSKISSQKKVISQKKNEPFVFHRYIV